jgi:hypothetical protein
MSGRLYLLMMVWVVLDPFAPTILMILLGTTGRNTDVRHITSLRQVVYVQRIRCSKESLRISSCILHLKMARRARNM